jgi:hypothetical protein
LPQRLERSPARPATRACAGPVGLPRSMDGRVGRVHRRAGNRGLSGRRRYGGRAGWPATDGALGGGGAASRALADRGRGNGCWSGCRLCGGVATTLAASSNSAATSMSSSTVSAGPPSGSPSSTWPPRGVVVNIATQPGDETVSFRAKCFDRARGAAIYTLNLPDELTSHASAASDLTAPSRPAVPASPAPHPAAHRTCCRTAHPQIPQRRRLDSSMVAPASRPPINPPDGSARPAAPKPPKICPD